MRVNGKAHLGRIWAGVAPSGFLGIVSSHTKPAGDSTLRRSSSETCMSLPFLAPTHSLTKIGFVRRRREQELEPQGERLHCNFGQDQQSQEQGDDGNRA